jgi:hypothetical protein
MAGTAASEGVQIETRPRHEWVRELMVARLGVSTMRGHHRT